MSSGVCPFLSHACTSARARTSIFVQASMPSAAAECSGVTAEVVELRESDDRCTNSDHNVCITTQMQHVFLPLHIVCQYRPSQQITEIVYSS